jgi:hypothetical protein
MHTRRQRAPNSNQINASAPLHGTCSRYAVSPFLTLLPEVGLPVRTPRRGICTEISSPRTRARLLVYRDMYGAPPRIRLIKGQEVPLYSTPGAPHPLAHPPTPLPNPHAPLAPNVPSRRRYALSFLCAGAAMPFFVGAPLGPGRGYSLPAQRRREPLTPPQDSQAKGG